MKQLATIAIILLLVSCAKKYDAAKTSQLNAFINQTGQSSKYSEATERVYFVNVDEGCETCIDRCLTFAKKNEGNSKCIFFIITAYDNTIRRISGQYGITFRKGDNLILDKELLATKQGLVSIFPIAYIVKDKKVAKSVNIDASNIDQMLTSN